MVLFSLLCLIMAFVFFKRLCPNISKKSNQEKNIDNSICLILPEASSSLNRFSQIRGFYCIRHRVDNALSLKLSDQV